MEFITVKEASEQWNISTRRVCILCKNGRIPGAVKKSKVWMIPVSAQKPEDARTSDSIRKINPFVLFFNPNYALYRGNLELNPRDEAICEMMKNFYAGNLEEAYGSVESLLKIEKDPQYAYFLNFAKMYIATDLGKKEQRLTAMSDLIALRETIPESALTKKIMDYYLERIDWISSDYFATEEYEELMPIVSIVSVKKGLNLLIHNGAQAGITTYEIICNELEHKECPLICAYYHIYLAVYLNAIGMADSYNYHIHRAVDILLPLGWYTPLAEYSATLDFSFIRDIDSKAYKTIEKLSERIVNNYIKVGIFDALVNEQRLDKDKNIQVGLKIVQGKNNEEIARELGISLYKVKQHIEDLLDMTGATSKKEIKTFILRNFFL